MLFWSCQWGSHQHPSCQCQGIWPCPPISFLDLSGLWAADIAHGYPTGLSSGSDSCSFYQWSWMPGFSRVSSDIPVFFTIYVIYVIYITCLSLFLPELDNVVMQWCCKEGGCGAWGFTPQNLVAREWQSCCPDWHFYISTFIVWVLGLIGCGGICCFPSSLSTQGLTLDEP